MYQLASKFSLSLMSKVLFLAITFVSLLACSSQMPEEFSVPTDSNVETISNVQLAHPDFIKKMLVDNKSLPDHEQATAITRYTYKGEMVYLVTPPCCDFMSKLYNSDGVLLGSPSGGITGRGDGSLADFEALKSEAFGIWKKGK